MHVLVVEDNPADVHLLREALNETGVPYTMHALEDGEEALRFLSRPSEQRFDVVLLDVNLPRVNGDAVLQQVRRADWLRGVPILVMSSSQSPKDRTRAEELGATFVPKAADLDDFLAIGRRIVEAARGSRGWTEPYSPNSPI